MTKNDQIVNHCDCVDETSKKILIEYLYLDLESCDRCIGTDKVLDEVMLELTPVFNGAGYKVNYQKTEMKTEEIASQHQFISSPTIRVNGKDICTNVKENNCGCCSEISQADVDCRIFEFEGKDYEVPPKEMITNEILSKVFSGCCSEKPVVKEYQLPHNLKVFYSGKDTNECMCKEECC